MSNKMYGPQTREGVGKFNIIYCQYTNECGFHIDVSMCGFVVLPTAEQ